MDIERKHFDAREKRAALEALLASVSRGPG